jgi:hypothetical protein
VWAAQQTFAFNGKIVCVRTNDVGAHMNVLALFPNARIPLDEDVIDVMVSILYGGEPNDGLRPFHLAYVNHKRVARTHDFDELLRIVCQRLGVGD